MTARAVRPRPGARAAMTRRTAPRPGKTVTIPLSEYQALLRAGVDPVTLYRPGTSHQLLVKAVWRGIAAASLVVIAGKCAAMLLRITGLVAQ